MNNPSHNRRRIFDKVLSVEAWHSTFDKQTHSASVHVDVSFLKARLGEEPESPVRFDVALKRAEIVFIIPANEPLKVIQSSVARETPRSGKATVGQNIKTAKTFKGKISTPKVTELPLKIDAGIKLNKEFESRIEIEAEAKNIEWAQAKDAAGNYCWAVRPGIGDELLGKIWNAVREPLLTVVSQDSKENIISPVCRIEVRCKRDDISITNLQSKKSLLEGGIFENKKAAAEAFIKKALSNRNLQVIHFEDPYGDISLADIMVEEEVG